MQVPPEPAENATDPGLPYLAMTMGIEPETVAVGEAFTVTIAIANQSEHAAADLQVRAPLPAGVQLQGDLGVRTWTWQQARLEANATTTLTTTMLLRQAQPGEALVLNVEAISAGMPSAARGEGGAPIVQRNVPVFTAQFTPGKPLYFRSPDGSIEALLPGNASNQALTIRYGTAPPAGKRPAHGNPGPGKKRGLPTFYLNATDSAGNEVHQFASPLTITATYTLQQLEALGLAEGGLNLYWFDENAPNGGNWMPIDTEVDKEANKVVVEVDHFTGFKLGDGSSPSAQYLPTLQGWQVGLYTGDVGYQFPIEVPAGPGGMKPNIALNYSSTDADGKSGLRPLQQAGWAGKGWSLDTGYIGVSKLPKDGPTTPDDASNFSLVFDGKSFDLVRGEERAGGAGKRVDDLSRWEWRPTDESFIRARAEYVADMSTDPTLLRGGKDLTGTGWKKRYKWQVWSTDGTRFDFEDDAWSGWQDCESLHNTYVEPYKWYLTRVEDINGNTVNYTYNRNARNLVIACDGTQPGNEVYADYAVWPNTISWGSNPSVGGYSYKDAPKYDRYKVQFEAWGRTGNWDTRYEGEFTQPALDSGQLGGGHFVPHETKYLKYIKIYTNQSNPSTTTPPTQPSTTAWDLVRQYALKYADDPGEPDPQLTGSLLSDASEVYRDGANVNWYYAVTDKPKVTLRKIYRQDNTGSAGLLPPATFTYGMLRHDTERYGGCNLPNPNGGTTNVKCSAEYWPRGDWNRLTKVENGYGGKATFSYENIGYRLTADIYPPVQDVQRDSRYKEFRNNRRIIKKELEDGRGNTYAWDYAYYQPAYNTFGSANAESVPNANPNSAKLIYARSHNKLDQVVHAHESEFRGHGRVVETGPPVTLNGVSGRNVTEHWFYQGDAGCNTLVVDETANSCFDKIRTSEYLKGKEYRTVTRQGDQNGPILSEVQHKFTVARKSDSGVNPGLFDPVPGLWRAFKYESETIEKPWEGAISGQVDPNAVAPSTSRTEYEYDESLGNIIATNEYAASGALHTRTENGYVTTNLARNDIYVTDRKWRTTIKDGSNPARYLAHTVYGWDGAKGGNGTNISRGRLTLERKYFNLYDPAQNQGPTQNTTPPTSLPTLMLSQDTSYGYDSYGNQETVTTYADAGRTDFSLASPYGEAGDCSGCTTRSTTKTDFDNIFHALPVKITPPIAALAETAAYDATLNGQVNYGYRMGIMTSITDPNGRTTRANYDRFGRLIGLAKPYDTLDVPTTSFEYGDNLQPFRYVIRQREQSGNAEANTVSMSFYDGLGRQIQTKTESVDEWSTTATPQTIVVDTVYDGLGQVFKSSSPRYISQARNSGFYNYLPTSGQTIQWTTTEYDALGRTRKVITPDNKFALMTYGVRGNERKTVATDANNHKKAQYSDTFGRVVEVGDYVNPNDPSTYSTTTYGYNPLGLLTSVLDAKGASTTVGYDSLGHKTRMSDPTMGTWNYKYNADGTLSKQLANRAADGTRQTTEFDYDAMDRLRFKRHRASEAAAVTEYVEYVYDQSFSANGKGQRTTMQRVVGGGVQSIAQWQFDERGRQTQVAYYAGLPNGARNFFWSYDAADRIKQLTYPTGEVVYYKYDGAGRARSVCSDDAESNCYARSAQYTELDQQQSLTYGNGLVQTHEYEGLMKRLWKLNLLKYDASGNASNMSNRTYGYDAVGNVLDINSANTGEKQNYTYDHLDRLKTWTITSGTTTTVSESYSYDTLGNITTKGPTTSPVSYSYNSAVGNGGPYAVDSLSNGQQFEYDANGNMTKSTASTSGEAIAERRLDWNLGNLPASVTSGGVTESYTYDAEGERLTRAVSKVGYPTTTTYYLGGLYEEDQPSGVTRSLYTLNGQVVAQSSTDPDPYGNHDTATTTVVEGWACDPSNYSKPVAIHIYDGWGFLPNYNNYIGAVLADKPREQGVAGSCGGYANHGFAFTLPEYRPDGTKLKDGQTHTIVAYIIGIDADGNGNARVVGTWNTGHQVTLTPPTPTPDPCPAQAVTWQNLVGVSVSGSTLTKTAPTGWGNAGASSSKQITSGDGYVEATAGGVGTNQDGFIGLSNGDSNPNWTDVDFGLQWWYGVVHVYEGGTSRGSFGSTTAGDVFRVAVTGGVVRYYKNGTLLYTSTVAPTYPLLMDVAISGTGSTINNAFIKGCNLASAPAYTPTPTPTNTPGTGALVCEPVVWQNARYVSVVGDTITKNAGTSGAWDAGASSTRGLLSGEGYAEFTVYSTAFTPKMFGFGKDDINWHVSDVEWAAYPHSASLYAYEGTIHTGGGNQFGPFSPSLVVGEKVRVHVAADGVVRYMRDGGTGTWTTYHTTTRPVTAAEYPLRVDTSILYLNTKLSVTLCGTNLGNVTPPGGGVADMGAARAPGDSDTGEASADSAQITFADVPQDSAFYGYVQAAYGRGIVSGYSEGGVRTFRPSATATRGQLVKMMVLAFNLPVSTGDQDSMEATASKQQFSDVPASHPFYSYIQAAHERGLVSGYADGTFKPDAPVTRGQLAKVAVLAAGLASGAAGEDPANIGDTTYITDTTYLTSTTGTTGTNQASFSDVPSGSTFYRYVETAYAYGILHGYDSRGLERAERTFRPDEKATRGQIAKTVYLAAQAPGKPWAFDDGKNDMGEVGDADSVEKKDNQASAAPTAITNATATGTSTSGANKPIDANNVPARTVIPYLPARQVAGAQTNGQAEGSTSTGTGTGTSTGTSTSTGTTAGGEPTGAGSMSAPAPYAATGPTVPNALTTVVYIHADHLGSTSMITDQGGNLVSSQQYDPWGKVRSGTPAGGVTQTKLNYTGQLKDETGLLYYGARYYNPSLARFVSPDSIVPGVTPLLMDLGDNGGTKDGTEGTSDPQRLNRYSYVSNNPLGNTDPSGHRTVRGGGGFAYRMMVRSMYKTLRNAVDNDPDFGRLRQDLADGLGTVEGLNLWRKKVEKGGAWDAGVDIRALYGAGPDDPIYFDAGGRKDVAYTLFGNILFGYLGAGVGYSADSLANQGALFNWITDPKGNSQADVDAVAFGIALWNKYGPNISEEDLAREIEEYMRTHKVHTKKSIAGCMSAIDGEYVNLVHCHGEAPK